MNCTAELLQGSFILYRNPNRTGAILMVSISYAFEMGLEYRKIYLLKGFLEIKNLCAVGIFDFQQKKI
jgi:hypothetical protein